MNNKGQVLVLFVIILPIFLIMISFVIDLGLLAIEKRKLDNSTYDAIEYYLEESDKAKTIKLLENNLSDVKININDYDEYVLIIVKKDYKSLYTIISNNKEIKVVYKGIKNSKEIIKG